MRPLRPWTGCRNLRPELVEVCTVAGVTRCIHEFESGTCELCSPRTPAGAAPQAGPFVWIRPALFFHLPDCSEVLWDPSEAAKPGERVNLTVLQVKELLRDGELERGCLKCGANAGVPD